MIDHIEVFTQSSIRIEGNAHIFYIDPFQMRTSPKDADYVLITHDHFDHFSPEDIKKVSTDKTVLVFPVKMADQVRKALPDIAGVEPVIPGETYILGDVQVETVPAYNRIKPFHPKHAGWVGYIITTDGRRIYIAGDTDATKEAAAVRCDIALVPIGGKFTMDAAKAAELVNKIAPSAAIPTHYGQVVGNEADAAVFKGLVKPGINVEIIKQY